MNFYERRIFAHSQSDHATEAPHEISARRSRRHQMIASSFTGARLRRPAQAEARRLLRVLFLWLRAVSTDPGGTRRRACRAFLLRYLILLMEGVDASGSGC